jgi:carbonic anhydrase
VVCGHSECGAMKAVIASSTHQEAPNLAKWLHHAHGAAFRLEHEGALDAKLKPHDQLSRLNVLVQLEHLMSLSDRAGTGGGRNVASERLVIRSRVGDDVRLRPSQPILRGDRPCHGRAAGRAARRPMTLFCERM